MAKTSTDAQRHIQELSRIFSDGKCIVEAVMRDLINAHKRKKYLKQSLRRLSQRGFIILRNGNYVPTKTGIRFFRRKTLAETEISKPRWDGKWRLIAFDVPVQHDAKRHRLRALLKEFDFYQLQKSVWICPTLLSEEFWKIIVMYELEKYCEVMIVEILEGDEKLRKHFGL